MRKLFTILFLLPLVVLGSNPFSSGHYVKPIYKSADWGNTYNNFYIATTGDDATGTGSISQPWKTLYKATTTVTTGNTVNVNAGIYLETLQSVLATGVSIEGTDSATCIIRSTATADYVPILIALSAEGTNGNQHISGLKFDGQAQATSWALSISGRSNFSIHDCTFIDFNDAAIYWRGRNDASNSAPTIWATGNSFYNNRTFNCSRYTSFGTGHLYFGGQRGMKIYNNYMVQKGRGTGLNGWLIKCQANDGYYKRLSIYNNTFIKDQHLSGGLFDFGVELFYGDTLSVANNSFTDCGLDMNYQDSVSIYSNNFATTGAPSQTITSITTEFSSTNVNIHDNTANGFTQFLLLTPRVSNEVTNYTVRNNLVTNMGQVGGGGTGIFAIAWITNGMTSGSTITCDNLLVVNNTFVTTGDANATTYGYRLPDGNPDAFPTIAVVTSNNVFVYNNIFKGFSATPAVANPASGLNSLLFRNNIFYNNGNSDLPIYNNGSPNPVNYVYDGQITTDPLLGVDWLPGIGSPALGAAYGGGNIGYLGAGVVVPGTRFIIKGRRLILRNN